jgi:cytohesin
MSIIPTDAADVASSPLLGAVHAGRVDNARVLLEHGADPNVGMMPPLAFAIFKEDIEMAKLLLSFGAATTGHTISSFAKDKPEFAALLSQQRGTEWHHFVASGNADAVQRALENGANVNARDDKENTALNIAAKCGDIAMAALLLQKGAEVNAGDSSQMTPLHTAINAESLPMVALLLEHGADVNAETKYGMTPLRLTSSEKRSAMRELLLAQGARVDFAVAMLLGDTATVRQRLEEGTPVDLADPSGLTALMAAAMRGDEAMLVELHDRWGADVNARDTFGNTALVHALTPAKSNAEGVDMTFPIIDRLLLWGSDIEAESNVGTTPLKTAVMSRNPALVTALLDRGANPNHRTPRVERTVLHDLMLFVPLYEEFTTIVQLLIDRGADVNARNKSEETPLIALLQSASLRKDEKDREAGIARTLSMIDLLVAHGADINAQGSFGKDVLSAAIDTGRVEIVRCVLDHGAKLDDGGMGSLMLVMKQESPEIVALLRERGVAEVKLPGMDSVPKEIFAQLASGKRPFNPVQVMREKMKERQQQPWITPDSRNGES